MEFREFSAKTVDEAITKACLEFGVSSEKLEIQVIFEGSSGFFGLGAKPARIRVHKKEEILPEEPVVEKVIPVNEKKVVKEPVKEIKKGIIANPNCSTIQAMVPLKPLYDKYGLKRIVYSTYQAVSGSGVRGVKDLEDGIEGKPNQFYPHPIAFNCLPHIDVFMDNGYTKEEMKMVNETKKIFGDDSIKVTATTVRVPVRGAHSESINVEFNKPFELEDIFEAMKNTEGVVLVDNPAKDEYPLAIDAEGHDEVYVGRIRRDFSVDNGINLWVVADNIRKGAATNAVQIAELLIKYDLV